MSRSLPRGNDLFTFGAHRLQPIGSGHWQLVGSRCPGCGLCRYPFSDLCPACWKTAEPVGLGPEGVVYSFTRLRAAEKEGEVSFLAYVDMPDDVRVLGWVDASSTNELQIGDRVRLSPKIQQAHEASTDPTQVMRFETLNESEI